MIVGGIWLWEGSPGPRLGIDGPPDLGAVVMFVSVEWTLYLARYSVRWHWVGAENCYHAVVVGFAACPLAYGPS